MITFGSSSAFQDGAGCNANRSGTENDHTVTRADAAAAFDDRVVCHAGWLDQAAGDEHIFRFIVLAQRIQAPHCAGGQDHIFCICAIDIESNFIQAFAVIGVTIRAGLALTAP